MKTITQEQIKTIVDSLYQINAPVQVYKIIQEMLSGLPNVETYTENVKEE